MPAKNIKNVTIIGGGTTGWLTALYAKTVMPTKTITLIESEDIGIIGVGEGSTPPLVSLLDILEIPVSRLIKEASTTLKNGIKFTNWNNEGEDDFYYNSFSANGNLSPYSLSIERFAAGNPPLWGAAMASEDKQVDYDYMAAISEVGKVPFRVKQDQSYSTDNPIFQFEQMGAFSIHFDAKKLVEVLSDIGKERGIIHIEGEVIDFKEDADGNVSSLELAHGAEIQTDFIFDCSGFNSFFKDKFDGEWISSGEKLTVNSAIPFFLEMDEIVPPYTEAIAMKYGWVWKIPLQDRYGCGYVFDSNHITEEEARKEVTDWLGYEPEWPRKKALTFNSGYLKEPWKKNVVSTGLAASFIEPLEATAIWLSMVSIARILGNTEVLYRDDQRLRDDYNENFRKIQETAIAFIYAHYVTGRTDTEFWKHYTKDNAPEMLKSKLDTVEIRNLLYEDIAPEAQFTIDVWNNILIGIRYPHVVDNLKEFEFYNFSRSHLKNSYHFYKKTIEEVTEFESVTHNMFLEKLIEKE